MAPHTASRVLAEGKVEAALSQMEEEHQGAIASSQNFKGRDKLPVTAECLCEGPMRITS